MTTPAGMTDLFPAFSLGAVALLNLMARLAPPPTVRHSVVGALALVLALYLTDRLHLWLPDRVGLPLYVVLLAGSSAIIAWNWRSKRAAKSS
jgi:prepilin signal peptidase PulO-like enzyme (type II secretory pathway)